MLCKPWSALHLAHPVVHAVITCDAVGCIHSGAEIFVDHHGQALPLIDAMYKARHAVLKQLLNKFLRRPLMVVIPVPACLAHRATTGSRCIHDAMWECSAQAALKSVLILTHSAFPLCCWDELQHFGLVAGTRRVATQKLSRAT